VAYRDDLAAAIARIQTLEEQLAREGSANEHLAELRARTAQLESELARLEGEREDRSALRARNARLEDEVARMKREIEDLSERLYGRPSRPDLMRMRSLADHNRQCSPRLSGLGSGVVCPSCLATGERVEMVRPSVALVPDTSELKLVLCPACAMLGLVRVS
jgi:predicted nuclease with TOPRIM domain